MIGGYVWKGVSMKTVLASILLACCWVGLQCMWVKEMENPGMYQGDIMLDPDENERNYTTGRKFASIIGGRWPGAKVPYVITSSIGYYVAVPKKSGTNNHWLDDNSAMVNIMPATVRWVFSTHAMNYGFFWKYNSREKLTTAQLLALCRPLAGSRGRQAIRAAIEQYHAKTCIRFHPRTNEREYLSFYKGGGCSSWVGHRWGRVNHVSLAAGCWYVGTVMHEIGHSLGFEHEQNRPDRDKYVEIIWRNIQQGMADQFYKADAAKIDSLGTPYDFQSMMHYGSTAFGINYRQTIRTKDPSKQRLIGYEGGASKIDVIQLNLMYCDGKPQPTPACMDKDKNCDYWAEHGECKKNPWMLDNCCKACKKIAGKKTEAPLTPQPGTEPPRTAVPAGCKNDNARCEEWAKRGECYTSHGHWMRNHCCKACREFGCPGECEDKDKDCQWWASRGQCKDPGHGPWMRCNCCQSCLDKTKQGTGKGEKTSTGMPDY